MPVIICLVPQDTQQDVTRRVRSAMREALQNNTGLNVTVEFVPTLFPERLVVDYETRSYVLEEELGALAQRVGQVIEKEFRRSVECKVRHAGGTLGIYVSR